MSNLINLEVKFFLTSIAWGVILLVIYDCLRIFRKVIKHGYILISVEDILYWMVCSVLIFRMMYQLNDGIIRGFSLLGILLGMVLYKYSISEYVVKGISFVLIKIKKLIQKIIHILTKPVRFVLKQIKRFFAYLKGKIRRRLGIMAHFMQKRVLAAWKALQRKFKRGRMNTNNPEDDMGNVKSRSGNEDGSKVQKRIKKQKRNKTKEKRAMKSSKKAVSMAVRR